MEILQGKTAGFCGGVNNAIKNTQKDLEKYNKVYCLGELVHNSQIINELEAKGLLIVDDLSQARERLIIRSHGVEKSIYEKAKEMNIELLDYTCPKVLSVHNLVEEYANKGYYIILVGEYEHPEVIGTYSFCGEYKSKADKPEDIKGILEKIKQANKDKVLVVAHTTFSSSKFDEIVEELMKTIPANIQVEVQKTICNSTELRQNEARQLSKEVDLMIVIGGKNSSNTKKLYEISKNNCKSLMVETYKEIDKEYVKQFEKVGIMAGSSTPQKSIQDVIEYIKA